MVESKLIQKEWKKLKKEMVIKSFSILISIMLISCSFNECQEDPIYNYIISYEFDKYAKGDFSQNSPYNIVLLSKNEEYYMIPINILYPIYCDLYSETKYGFNSFVCETLTSNNLLDLTPYLEINSDLSKLELNSEIKDDIEKNGLFNLLEKYGISSEEKAYVMYSNDFDDTILYEFYKLGYLHTWDDFTGRHIFVNGNIVWLSSQK